MHATFTKDELRISAGSAEIYLRYGVHCYTSFVANATKFLAVKESRR